MLGITIPIFMGENTGYGERKFIGPSAGQDQKPRCLTLCRESIP